MSTNNLSHPLTASLAPRPEKVGGDSFKRIVWVDIAKGLSVLLIVFGHVLTWAEYLTGQSEALRGFVTMLTPVRIPMFFFVSGLFAVGVLTGPRERVVHRVADLFKVFVLWSVITFLLEKTFFHRFPAVEKWTYDAALNALALPHLFTWFLWALAVFTLLGSVGVRHAPRITLFAAVAMLFALELIPTYLPGTHTVGGRGFYGNFLFFILPFYLPAAQQRISSLPPTGAAAMTGISYCLLLFIEPHFEGHWFQSALRIGATAIGVTSLLCIARLIESQRRVGHMMAALGRKTLPIYLTHFLIGMALMLMIDSAGLFGSPIGNTLLILAVTATCAFLGTFIEQVMPPSARDFLFVPNRRRKIV
ncbi:MAG: acyltransferase family protein [Erythrobacter sp.]|uniref:acyltransferase family protein n=1 Tax=Qipengyuania pacifica TaxID=2860199 RepID=UPI0035C84919|nr:acyltransferase family protein [Erythrobacter sp.]